MYKIFCDDILLYDSMIEDYKITKGVITKELNKSGSFVFTIYSNHAHYDLVQKMKSIITVYKDSTVLFRGRVINETVGFYKDKTFTCEGDLGFLLDSVQIPGTIGGTPEQTFRDIIERHNSQVEESKQFEIGIVDIKLPAWYSVDVSMITITIEEYENTLDTIQKHLIDFVGGYIFVTTSATTGKRMISWFSESIYKSNQVIEFGENLLDFSKTNKAEDIATVLMPLGAVVDETLHTRLNIAEVNGGSEYIAHEEGVNLYGRIVKTEIWDDITDASILKQKGEAFLEDKVKQSITIELSAIDLSLMDKDIDNFQVGDYIRITSAPHGIDDEYLLEKQTIDLLKPDNDKISLGYSSNAFTDTLITKNNQNDTLVKTVAQIETDYALNTTMAETEETLRTLIDQTSTSITSEVLADYVVNEELESAVSTVYTQLNDLFEFKFSDLESVVNANDIEHRRAYREITSYIRFEDGNIILGESGNELTLKIENDKLSIREGDVEVAYFNNHKLYITDADILGSLRIGNFAYIPRANGNTSWKKIGG